MGFISFNENYYQKKIEAYENKILSSDDIYEIKQLLKVLDDLTDEGYTNLNNTMEKDFACITRLRNLLTKTNEKPFPIKHHDATNISYDNQKYPLQAFLNDIEKKDYTNINSANTFFLNEIKQYCDWIGYDQDTAYIFLLRDTLLPYLYFVNKKRDNIYPWLISRKFLADITNTSDVDDEFRLPIYEALENEKIQFKDLCSYYQDKTKIVMDQYPKLKETLLGLLASIKQKKIVVVESGYMGTIPMMLKSLDKRINFKLFTTAPFLYETYKDKIYTQKYELIREFETLSSQEYLFQYSSYHDNQFYIQITNDEIIKNKAFQEIKEITT